MRTLLDPVIDLKLRHILLLFILGSAPAQIKRALRTLERVLVNGRGEMEELLRFGLLKHVVRVSSSRAVF